MFKHCFSVPLLAAWATIVLAVPSRAQFSAPGAPVGGLEGLGSRLEAHEPRPDQADPLLNARVVSSSEAVYGMPTCAPLPEVQPLPVVVEVPENSSCAEDEPDPKNYELRFIADYDNGFVIRPIDPERHPFELKTNAWIQFRHHGFASDVETWTDNAGVVRPVRDRNAWDVERARLVLSGFALDQGLTYFLHMDGDTDGAETVDFFDYWWAWEFTDRFQVQFGKRKAPATRQWLLTARNTRFIDRPMANDFFRPDRTTGVTAIGRIGETGHYEAMVSNGYRTANLPLSETDNNFAFAATNYWDPLGDYGRQIVDYDFACDPLVRIGHSFVFSSQSRFVDGLTVDEPDFLRLTDGTQLTAPNALAPGVDVSQYDITLYGIDAAAKWRGWSVTFEYFFQWLNDFRGDGPLPVTDVFQHGFYIEGGRFLVPQKLDANVRYSEVDGPFGDASEIAGGFNWYPLDTPKMKISFDVTLLDGSPLNNTTSDILVGDDGILFRTQFQAEF